MIAAQKKTPFSSIADDTMTQARWGAEGGAALGVRGLGRDACLRRTPISQLVVIVLSGFDQNPDP